MQEVNKFQKKLPNQEIDYFKIGKILVSRWYWIAGTILLSLAVAKTYLWYTPKMYSTSATLKFEDKKSEFSDPSSYYSTANNMAARIQAELFVLQSNELILRAIKKIDYRISFSINGRVRTSDVYPAKLLNIQFITLDSLNFFRNELTFKPINKYSFSLSYSVGSKVVKNNYIYNNPVTLGPTTFVVKSPDDISSNTIFLFKFNAPEDLLGRVKSGLRPGEISKYSNIVNIQQTDVNPVFAAHILNAILTEYLRYDREQKSQSAKQIIDFINKQLAYLSKKVDTSSNNMESYQKNRKIVSVSASTDAALAKAKEIDNQKAALKYQLMVIDDLKNRLVSDKNDAALNFNISGSPDPLLGGIISSYNNLLIQRSGLLARAYNEQSPPVKELDRQILSLKNSAINNINSSHDAVVKNLAYVESQGRSVDQQIGTLPAAERDMFKLKRSFDINDKVYTLLQERKLDAQISSSAVLAGASIVDRAEPNLNPISPNEHDVNQKALIIGLLTGLGVIILIRLLNPYIYDKETVESLTNIPIIGVIRKFPTSLDEDNSQLIALTKPRSIFAESVRSVRTNLNFLASDKQNKVICITSEVAGEGKSFVAVNISSTLALIDKKVVLVGADLRRSRIHKTFNVPNDMGLSNYLAHQADWNDIVRHSEVDNLDFITSGPVPPNPSELLHSPRMQELLDQLRTQYDFIIVDTAPVGLVSDSIPLIRVSDVNVFVIRSGKSKYYSATVPQRIASEYNLTNTVIVLNAFEEDLLHSRYYTTRFTGDTYGTRYYYYSDYSGYAGSGYYLDDEKKKWWDLRRWLKI